METKVTKTWKNQCWKQHSKKVFQIQERIFMAYKTGDISRGQNLQRLLLSSWSARLLAVRHVTQISKGKRTPGVDGVTQSSPGFKLALAEKLSIGTKVRPVKRIFIPKKGTDETRPLGIPTIKDRAVQKLACLALDPQLEVIMTSASVDAYGYRRMRSRSDAIRALRNYADKVEGKWVAICDIEKFFDRVDHEAILANIDTWPAMRKYIKKILKAGILQDSDFQPSIAGTPQGGPISGILANWVIQGLEAYIRKHHQKGSQVGIIRYADDIRLIHKDREVLGQCNALIDDFLRPLGLNLHPDKTSIRNIKDGVEFLGYEIRQFCTPPKNKKSRKGFITLVHPSKVSIHRHYRRLAKIVDYHKAKSQQDLIKALNPVISGWARSYADVNASKAFSKLDHLLFLKLRRWAKRRHGNKSWEYIRGKYFNGGSPWIFRPMGDPSNPLLKHSATKIVPRVKTPKGTSIYSRSGWRRGEHPLAKKYASQSQDISNTWQDLRDESAISVEEPCEAKVSRTVLKTSSSGDTIA